MLVAKRVCLARFSSPSPAFPFGPTCDDSRMVDYTEVSEKRVSIKPMAHLLEADFWPAWLQVCFGITNGMVRRLYPASSWV